MHSEYPIFLASNRVGTAAVSRCGLYYRIQCVCSGLTDGPHRVSVHCAEAQADLGICVPVGEQHCIDTRIPVKRLGEGDMHFYLVQKKQFVPVYEDKPFAHIQDILTAHFAVVDAQPGIMIQNR